MSESRVENEQRTVKVWLLICAALTPVLIVAARIKGGYVDEYWTLGFAESSLPLTQAFQAWSMDTGHPVGFYALSRIGDLVLDPDIFVRRLSNLLFFVLAVLCAWRSPKHVRSYALALVATVAASPYVVERFAEYRATFLALMIVTMLILRVRQVAELGQARGKDAAAISVLMAALGLTDYPVAIAGLALCGALGIVALAKRDAQTFWAAAAGIGASLLVVGLSLANATRFSVSPSPYFQSWPGLARDVAVVLATAVLPCVVVIGFALVRILRSPPRLRAAIPRDTFAQIIILSLTLMLAAILIINGATHSLIRRQLFGLVPLAVAAILAVAWPMVRDRTVVIVLIAVNLVAVSAATALHLRSKPYFNRFGEQLAQAQRACPSLPIYAVLPDRITGNATNPFPIPNQVALGYIDIARRHGFAIRSTFPADWLDPKCGAIIWSEYLWMDGDPTPGLVAASLGLLPKQLAGATTEYVDQSLLMRVPAPR